MMGRSLEVPLSYQGVALFPFRALCLDQPLGPADYIGLASAFHTVVLQGVPRLTQGCPEARRLVFLIDVMYERSTRLVIFADARPEELFTMEQFVVDAEADERPSQQQERGGGGGATLSVRGEGGSSSGFATTFIGQGVEWSATGRKGVSLAELSGLQDTGFSFQRAVSRLIEMSSREYLDRWREKHKYTRQ
jgi:protein AFG1